MSFAVLPRRDMNPDITTDDDDRARRRWRSPTPRSARPMLDELEVQVIDAARGELEAPVGEWSLNSLGAMQGGAVATVVDAAAEVAARAASGEPLVVTDIQLTYLALARVGPVRTRVDVLGVGARRGRPRTSSWSTPAPSRGSRASPVSSRRRRCGDAA